LETSTRGLSGSGAKTRDRAEGIGKYTIRPLLSLECPSLDEKESKVCRRVIVRYYGLNANAHRGKINKASLSPLAIRMVEDKLKFLIFLQRNVYNLPTAKRKGALFAPSVWSGR
jgi:hypothetical protein